MRLASYEREGAVRAALIAGDFAADIEAAAKALLSEKLPAEARPLLADKAAWALLLKLDAALEALGRDLRAGRAKRPAWLRPLDTLRLAPPVPDPGKIMAVGLNYQDHIDEQGKHFGKRVEAPREPVIFAKFTSALAGPFATIHLPPAALTRQVDHEVELACVLGAPLRDADAKQAAAAIAGYMVMNDLSARDCQFADRQWTRAKSFDGFAPCGPWLTSADTVTHPQRLKLWCEVDGERRQEGNTRAMIFKIADILAHLSRGMTLQPGDILATGTPAGVGAFHKPPRFLAAGQTVVCGAEGLGSIRNLIE